MYEVLSRFSSQVKLEALRNLNPKFSQFFEPGTYVFISVVPVAASSLNGKKYDSLYLMCFRFCML